MPNISQIPLNKVPFLDERNPLLVSREWYRFLNNLFTLTGSGSNDVSLGDVQLNPAPTVSDELSVAMRQINDLFSAPTYTPHVAQDKIGGFYDTTDQAAAAINTLYLATFNTTNFSQGVVLGTTTSRITVLAPGVYSFGVTLHCGRTGGPGGDLKAWLRKNGTTDLAGSGITQHIAGGVTETSAGFVYMVSLAANDYVEIAWAVTNVNLRLEAVAAAAPYPAIPSVHVNVHNLTG